MDEEIKVEVTAPEPDVSDAVDDAIKVLAVADAIAASQTPDAELIELARATLDELASLRQEVADVKARVGETYENIMNELRGVKRQEEITQALVINSEEPVSAVEVTEEPSPVEETITETIEIPKDEEKPVEIEKTKTKRRWV